MTETFRLRRFFRNLGIVGLAFFGCLLLLVVCCFVWRPVQGPDDRLVMSFMTGIFAANAALFAWPLLAFARGSLSISEASVVKSGIIRAAKIDLAELTEVCWDVQFGGTIRLRSLRARLDVYLPSYEPEAWARIIELLRWWAPVTFQHGWDAFCCNIALPQRELNEGRPLRDHERLLTRRGMTTTVVFVILFLTAAFAARGWWLGEASYLRIVPMILVISSIWLPFVWFVVPVTGRRVKGRVFPHSGKVRFLSFVGSAISFTATFLFIAVAEKLSAAIVFIITLLVVWGVRLLIRLPEIREMRRQQRDYQPNVAAAAEEWERLEREGGAAI